MSFSSPEKPNPYVSPSCAATDPLPPFTLEQAQNRVTWPAIGLGFVSCLAILFGLYVMTVLLSSVGYRIVTDDDQAQAVAMSTALIWLAVILLAPPSITLAGAVQMFRLRSYYLALSAALLGIMPCTVCFPLLLPFGIWALVVLWDTRMRDAFSTVARLMQEQWSSRTA